MKTINPNLNEVLNGQGPKIKEAHYYIHGIIKDHDFVILAEAITLLESENIDHQKIASEILIACEQVNTESCRLGITGSPGVGKSTFIECITPKLLEKYHRAAVLTIDPSSIDNRGSILGDKTRMESLSQDQRVFVRPSPSRQHLGGTHAMTYEAIVMCEAAGIDLIVIETVGVGQSEYAITDIVDCAILLLLPGAGDDLQGIKKGITQIADIIVIHKADGDRMQLAQKIARDYESAIHISRTDNSDWSIPVCQHSSIEEGYESHVYRHIENYMIHMKNSSRLQTERSIQRKKLLRSRLLQFLHDTIDQKINKHTGINNTIEHSHDHIYSTLSTIKQELNIEIK